MCVGGGAGFFLVVVVVDLPLSAFTISSGQMLQMSVLIIYNERGQRACSFD